MPVFIQDKVTSWKNFKDLQSLLASQQLKPKLYSSASFRLCSSTLKLVLDAIMFVIQGSKVTRIIFSFDFQAFKLSSFMCFQRIVAYIQTYLEETGRLG